ncbi:MAG: TrmH family RNA methyltransferase [Halioglobus sp.]
MSNENYQKKKARFERMLTVYGRNAVRETLNDLSLTCHALHLADSNRESKAITELLALATNRGIEIQRHNRDALARISKNGKQDQGVALDVVCPAFGTVDGFLADGLRSKQRMRLLALDGISNPQNLGMIIRSAAAGAIDGIVLARKGNAALGPLVIKASAGTVYRAPLLLCDTLPEALSKLQAKGANVYCLAADGAASVFEKSADSNFEEITVYVLGNETEGVSSAVRGLADAALHIPMGNGVESLNVAVSASLIAYAGYLER